MSDEIVVEYRSRAVISDDKVEFNPTDNTLTIYERKDCPLPTGIRVTLLWNLWCYTQLIFHLTLKVSFNIVMPKAARPRAIAGNNIDGFW